MAKKIKTLDSGDDPGHKPPNPKGKVAATKKAKKKK